MRHLRTVKDHGLLVIMEWSLKSKSTGEDDEDESPECSDGSSEANEEGSQSSVDFK